MPMNYVRLDPGGHSGRMDAQRIATGPASVFGADAVRRDTKPPSPPWPHVEPPLKSMRRTPNGYVACPPAAVQAEILAFQVPQGHFFYLHQIGLYFRGGSWTIGDFLFTVDQNTPLGATIFQGVPLTDFQAIPYPVGTPELGPVELPRAELFAPSDWIRAKVINVNLAGGPPLMFGAWFGGYLLPASESPRSET